MPSNVVSHAHGTRIGLLVDVAPPPGLCGWSLTTGSHPNLATVESIEALVDRRSANWVFDIRIAFWRGVEALCAPNQPSFYHEGFEIGQGFQVFVLNEQTARRS